MNKFVGFLINGIALNLLASCPLIHTASTLAILPMGFTHVSDPAVLLSDGRVLLVSEKNFVIYDPLGNRFSVAGSAEGLCAGGHCSATLLADDRAFFAGDQAAAIFDPIDSSIDRFSLRCGQHGKSATLLPNGTVLITGGCSDLRAEIYDPRNRSLHFTGKATIYRTQPGAGATLLNNGKVLFAGGQDWNGKSLTSAEEFDPESEKFAPTGNLAAPRGDHSATLLPDGNVLLAGGIFASRENHGELFVPWSGKFVTSATMKYVRVHHTATLLPSGDVLLAGGFARSTHALLGDAFIQPERSVEIFGHRNSKFHNTARMELRRERHSATALTDGRIFVAGGLMSRWYFWDRDVTEQNAEFLGPYRSDCAPQSPVVSFREVETAKGPSRLLVLGAGFTPRTTLKLDGVAVKTTYISSALVSTPIPAGNWSASADHKITYAQQTCDASKSSTRR